MASVSQETSSSSSAKTTQEIITEGKRVIKLEREALADLETHLGSEFARAVEDIANCKGKLVFSGMGKAGLIAQKIAATFSSLGKASFFMHPGEASHGDLGMISQSDIVLFLSNSGESVEIISILKFIQQIGTKIISFTATNESTLARESNVVLTIGKAKEACSMGLAPTTSTTLMLVLGDALAVAYLKKDSHFDERSFAFYHPGGSLGKRYARVKDVMRAGESLVSVKSSENIEEVLMKITKARVGSAVICNDTGQIEGIFSDGDLRRTLKMGGHILKESVGKFMSPKPTVVESSEYVEKAKEIMKGYKIGEIPVVDKQGMFIGLLSLRDIV